MTEDDAQRVPGGAEATQAFGDSQRIFVGTQRGAAPVPFTFTSAGAPMIASRVGNGARLVPLSADGAATCGSAAFALSGVTETLVTTFQAQLARSIAPAPTDG